MGILRIALAVGLMLAAASNTIPAEEPAWTIRFHGAILETSAEQQAGMGNGLVSSVDTGGGLGVGAEYRISRRLGLDLSILFAGLEIGTRLSSGSGLVQDLELGMMPITFAVPFHFDTGDRVDLYAGPTLNLVRYVDVRSYIRGTGWGTEVDVDSDTALGAALGIDIPFGKRKWAFSAGLRLMKTEADGTDVDPVIVTLGFARSFRR